MFPWQANKPFNKVFVIYGMEYNYIKWIRLFNMINKFVDNHLITINQCGLHRRSIYNNRGKTNFLMINANNKANNKSFNQYVESSSLYYIYFPQLLFVYFNFFC